MSESRRYRGSLHLAENTTHECRLMLLRLQEIEGWRFGHGQRDMFDRLRICMQAYKTELWRVDMECTREPAFLRC